MNQPLAAQIIYLLHPTVVIQPGILPHVKLHKVEAIQARVPEASMDVVLDVIGRKAIVQRVFTPAGPLEILGGNFGGGIELLARVVANQPSQQRLAPRPPQSAVRYPGRRQ